MGKQWKRKHRSARSGAIKMLDQIHNIFVLLAFKCNANATAAGQWRNGATATTTTANAMGLCWWWFFEKSWMHSTVHGEQRFLNIVTKSNTQTNELTHTQIRAHREQTRDTKKRLFIVHMTHGRQFVKSNIISSFNHFVFFYYFCINLFAMQVATDEHASTYQKYIQ